MKSLLVVVVLADIGAALYKTYRSYAEEGNEARTVKSLPPSIQHVVVQMDGASQAAFFNEYEQKKKKKFVGYLLWFPFFGLHYAYTRKIGLQFVYWFTGAGLGLRFIADFFRMPSIIRSANEQTARQALQTLQIAASFAPGGTYAAGPATHPPLGFTARQPQPPRLPRYSPTPVSQPRWPTANPAVGSNATEHSAK